MKIYVIEDSNELVGKTIQYIELNRFSIPAIIVTADGGIMIWKTSAEDETFSEEIEIDIYSKHRVEAKVFSDDRMIERILKFGILTKADFDNFFAEQIEKREKEQKEWRLQKEENDRKEFERLSEKFKNGADK